MLLASAVPAIVGLVLLVEAVVVVRTGAFGGVVSTFMTKGVANIVVFKNIETEFVPALAANRSFLPSPFTSAAVAKYDVPGRT